MKFLLKHLFPQKKEIHPFDPILDKSFPNDSPRCVSEVITPTEGGCVDYELSFRNVKGRICRVERWRTYKTENEIKSELVYLELKSYSRVSAEPYVKVFKVDDVPSKSESAVNFGFPDADLNLHILNEDWNVLEKVYTDSNGKILRAENWRLNRHAKGLSATLEFVDITKICEVNIRKNYRTGEQTHTICDPDDFEDV